MESRWMRRKNENGEEEKFYPITHAKAIVYDDDDKAIFDNIKTHLNDTNNPHGTQLTHLGVTATATELNYMDGVTSNIQTQLDGKAASGHTHTASDVGAVPTSRTVNGKALSSNITLSASDVGAIANNVFNGVGVHGTYGYVAFAQLKVTSPYVNRPIEFELICRGRSVPCYVSIMFNSTADTNTDIASLVYWGSDYGVFAQKTDTSTWLLYYTKSESWDDVTVVRKQEVQQGVTVTHPDTFITTVPTSNITHATLGGNIGYASSAGSASSAGTLSSTLPVNKGGTGTTSLTSGAALIGNGTGAVTTRAISNVTTNSTCAASTNLITANTLNYHVIKMLNRDTTVTGADTNYTSTKARGIDLLTYVPSSMINGAISLVYS